MPRPVRIVLLFAVLVGCVGFLLRAEPMDAMLAGQWKTSTPDGPPCVPDSAVARWDLTVEGDEVEGLKEALMSTVTAHCRGAACPVTHAVALKATWQDKPWFLSGFAKMHIDITIDRAHGEGCLEKYRQVFDVTVDHGTRGTVAATLDLVGRAIGRDLFRRFGPR